MEILNFRDRYFVDDRRFRVTGLFGKIMYVPETIMRELLKTYIIDESIISVENVLKKHPVIDVGYLPAPADYNKFPCRGWVYEDPWKYSFVGYDKKSFKTKESNFRKLAEIESKEVPITFFEVRIPLFTRYALDHTRSLSTTYPNLLTHKVKILQILTIDNRTGGFIDVV